MTEDHAMTSTQATSTQTTGTQTENTQAWQAQVAYHRDRAAQEQRLASRSRTDAGRAAHQALSDRHLQLAASAELVTDMPDAELPRSTSLHDTGRLIRESYSEAG